MEELIKNIKIFTAPHPPLLEVCKQLDRLHLCQCLTKPCFTLSHINMFLEIFESYNYPSRSNVRKSASTCIFQKKMKYIHYLE